MEYVAGGSLMDRIIKKGRLSSIESLKIITQVLEGVKHLHDNEIMHSDIKPENILLNNKVNVKLADFGYAVHEESVSINPTSGKGTPNYCSPEVFKGNPRSRENDCWSVGATLVHMVTGHSLKPQYDFQSYNGLLLSNNRSLKTALNDNDVDIWVEKILSQTLCAPEDRSTAPKLLEICQSVTIPSNSIGKLI